MNRTEKSLGDNSRFEYFIVFEGIIIGIVGGLVVSLYRLILAKAFDFAVSVYGNIDRLWEVAAMFAVLVLLGLFVGFLVKKEPMISGSGIPQVEGALIGRMRFKWFRVLALKFISGIICLGSGMSLGREGPSVQIGASTGLGISRFFKSTKTAERYLFTFGAASGLAAAFNAPFAGVLFVMEELHKSFNKYVFIGGMMTGITADMVAKKIFGLSPVFTFGDIIRVPYSSMHYVILLGAALGIAAVIFNKLVILGFDKYGTNDSIPEIIKPVPAFVVTGIVALAAPMLLGGGHELIELLIEGGLGLKTLVALFVIKFMFTQVCFASRSPGGIFLPMLSIGAVMGAAFSVFFAKYMGADPRSLDFFMAIAMAGFFGAVTKAPVTGIILICEMTGSFSQFLFLSVVTITAFMVTEVFKCGPVYEMLLHHSLNKGKPYRKKGKRMVIEIPVVPSSQVINKAVRELDLPESLLLISIRREPGEIVPKGDIILRNGDTLVILLYEKDLQYAEEYFNGERNM